MMTRKHFRALADEISRLRPSIREECARAVARVCRGDNPAFSVVQFYSACMIPTPMSSVGVEGVPLGLTYAKLLADGRLNSAQCMVLGERLKQSVAAGKSDRVWLKYAEEIESSTTDELRLKALGRKLRAAISGDEVEQAEEPEPFNPIW